VCDWTFRQTRDLREGQDTGRTIIDARKQIDRIVLRYQNIPNREANNIKEEECNNVIRPRSRLCSDKNESTIVFAVQSTTTISSSIGPSPSNKIKPSSSRRRDAPGEWLGVESIRARFAG